MKIVHCCFGNEHYIDTWGYQQNLLPLYHAKLGHETVVLASNDTYPLFVNKSVINEIKEKGNSYNNGLVRVERGPSWFHSSLHFQKAKGLFKILEKESPDIIFFHGSLNLSLLPCVRYRRRNAGISLFVDNHGDTMNVNPNKLYRFIFFKVFWSLIHTYCQRYVDKYFGVTEGRCDFLVKYFHIKTSNVQLLPIGADVDLAADLKKGKSEIRFKYGIAEDAIIIVHGGKLDPRKGTVDLINVYRQIKENSHQNLHLILFGALQDERIASLLDSDITLLGWLSRNETFEVFKMADLAIWPVHHTTLIEDCVAVGIPYLIRKTETTKHLIYTDFYLNVGDCEELKEKIESFLNPEKRRQYISKLDIIRQKINYYTIAEKVISLHNNIHA